MALRFSTGLRNRTLGIDVNLTTIGDFAANITGWTNTVGAAWASTTPNPPTGYTGYAELTPNNGVAAGEMRHTATITVGSGQMLKVKFQTIYAGSAGSIICNIGTTLAGTDIATATFACTAAWVQHEVFCRVPDGTTAIYLTFKTASTTGTEIVDIGAINVSQQGASYQEIFRKGFLKVYSGTKPASADNVPSGTLLCTYYSDGTTTGLTFDDAVAGVLSKAAAETWSGTAVANGTAGYYRLVAVGDDASSSTTQCRIDGDVATSGADLNMSSVSIALGAVDTISTYTLTMPAS